MTKKHPCPDCNFCQQCGEDRCRLCRKGTSSKKKLSFAEQIELYERINSGQCRCGDPEKKEGEASTG